MAAAAAERGGATALPQQECLCSACLWLPGMVLAVAHACAPKQALGLVRAGQAVLVSPCGVAPPCSVLAAVQRATRGGCGARIRWRLHLPQRLFGEAGECTVWLDLALAHKKLDPGFSLASDMGRCMVRQTVLQK